MPPFRSVVLDQWQFLRRLAAEPRHVGAVAPSSAALARAMAAQIDPAAPGRILELGPGTGVVTEALLARGIDPSRLTLIEFDRQFAAAAASRFPGVEIVVGDAYDLPSTLGPTELFAAIVSSLPLLNEEPHRRRALLSEAFARLAPDAPFVQFSYGLRPPVEPTPRMHVHRAARVLLNVPPAQVWVYRRSEVSDPESG
jgi:phosphatidylethanolamine/phosphatidyl-N-methylethanolamine N-methyltransferase